MARLRRCSAFLVPLVLALPLSVASKDSRTDQHKGEAVSPTEPIKQQEPQVPFSVWQSTESVLSESVQTIKQQAIAAEKQADSDKDTWCSPSVLVNIALVVIGFGYLIFAGLQWNEISKQARIANATLAETKKAADATERYVTLTKEMSETAKQSARAAEVALHINRPFLLVTKTGVARIQGQQIVDFTKPPPTTSTTPMDVLKNPLTSLRFKIELRNFGVGPADIKDYFCEAELFDPPRPQNGLNDPVVVYQDSQCNRLNDSLIAPNETVDDRLVADISFYTADRELIRDDVKRIGIHGRLRYRGAHDFTYVTRFFWWYFPDTDSCHRAFTEELNSHT
jgi:hypothetical protein